MFYAAGNLSSPLYYTKKSKLIWIANKETDTDVRQFFFPLYKIKTSYR
jgi:hypothetical protein